MPEEPPPEESTNADADRPPHGERSSTVEPEPEEGPVAAAEGQRSPDDSEATDDGAAPDSPPVDEPKEPADVAATSAAVPGRAAVTAAGSSDTPSGAGSLRTWSGRRTANESNAEILGELHLFYRERTVVLPLDGDAGLRLMAGWYRNRPEVWADSFHPSEAPARLAWAAISLEGVLAMMWLPGLTSSQPQRMAVDPSVG